MKVVLDTNVIVSGFTHTGNESLVLDMARDSLLEAYVSPGILDEAVGVLPRKFGWSPQRVGENHRGTAAIRHHCRPRALG